ncbi:glycoside hydrolase family 16 protein [Mycena amicta]|nr:glycoside hydrolase family 16 protein [Mycena amicta]
MLLLFLAASLALQAAAYTSYSVSETFAGTDFLDWDWYHLTDPTHGRTNYVNKSTAIANKLVSATDSTFRMGADAQNKVAGQHGRDSVRISSPKAYASDSVLVLDLQHMPAGCATWPAWWTVSQTGPWPRGGPGEIDIIEGVNENTQNLASLHTSPGCTMPQDQYRYQSGTTVSTNCDASFNYNQGCGVAFRKANSYGKGFNSKKGGIYAMQRSQSGVKIWFWSRDDPKVPVDVYQNSSTVDPDSWGVPEAEFPADGCSFTEDPHNMIFDLTFCGDWAGSDSAYRDSGCPSNCTDFVDNNPAAFKEAYWEINFLEVYTPGPQ